MFILEVAGKAGSRRRGARTRRPKPRPYTAGLANLSAAHATVARCEPSMLTCALPKSGSRLLPKGAAILDAGLQKACDSDCFVCRALLHATTDCELSRATAWAQRVDGEERAVLGCERFLRVELAGLIHAKSLARSMPSDASADEICCPERLHRGKTSNVANPCVLTSGVACGYRARHHDRFGLPVIDCLRPRGRYGLWALHCRSARNAQYLGPHEIVGTYLNLHTNGIPCGGERTVLLLTTRANGGGGKREIPRFTKLRVDALDDPNTQSRHGVCRPGRPGFGSDDLLAENDCPEPIKALPALKKYCTTGRVAWRRACQ